MKVHATACIESSRPSLTNLSWAGAVVTAAMYLAAGCGGGSSGGSSSSGKPGEIVANPNQPGTYFVVEANQSGNATSFKIVSLEWGRLVDIYDLDPLTQATEPRFLNTLVRDTIQNNNDFRLDRNPVTGVEILTILHPFGTPTFKAALNTAMNLQPVLVKGLDAGELPPFTALPRNCGLAIVFNDLVKADSASNDTLRLLTGYPPQTPFETRVVVDASHGAKIGNQFHTTRVILDMTTSQFEASQTAPPPQPNAVGLPPASVTTQPNVALRIPTKKNPVFGQFELLENLSAHPLAFSSNGPNDPFSPTLDLVRSMRSMGSTAIGDPNNGFLPDQIQPEIVGVQAVLVTTVTPDPTLGVPNYVVDLTFTTQACAVQAKDGFVLTFAGGVLALVTADSAPPVAGVLTGVQVEQIAGAAGALIPGQAQIAGGYDPGIGASPACYVRFNPAAGSPPADNVPAAQTGISVSFSEPMDPGSVQAFNTFAVTRTTVGAGLQQNVIGVISPSVDLQAFAFVPSAPLSHVQGVSESYLFDLIGGTSGVVDLAGNPLVFDLPAVTFTLNPNSATATNSGITLTFSSVDEEIVLDGGGNIIPNTAEVAGQQLYNLSLGIVTPRPVTRFKINLDTSQAVILAMNQLTLPIVTPLSKFGSKLMGVWRYCDMSFSVVDPVNHNIDVEGLSWAPFSPVVQVDQFPELQISLCHSKFLPDEVINPQSNLPTNPASGLVANFLNNQLDSANDPLKIVHPKSLGYAISPSDTFLSTSGSGFLLQPWPLNRTIPPSQFRYYTWRDTSIQAVAAPFGNGVDMGIQVQLGLANQAGKIYPVSKVPTIGLPLLMEYRVYPNNFSIGLNGFRVAFALNSSAAPYFRSFSTGGVLGTGQTVTVDPDNEPFARGGINPVTGQTTPPLDNTLYYGQCDFVVRVSRMFSRWFDTGQTTTVYLSPVVEPLPVNQPGGTQVILAYRGATAITVAGGGFTSGNAGAYLNALNLDPYGEAPTTNFSVTFLGNNTWKSSIALINGARYFQFRASFVSNAETGLSPVLSAAAFPYLF